MGLDSYRVNSIASSGAGVLSINGMTVFVDYTAPGDLVRVRLSEQHKNWARAELLEVLEPSPQRRKPCCPLFGTCGGCSLQHLSYAGQLTAKLGILKDALTRIGHFGPDEVPEVRVFSDEPWEFGYRNRVRLHSAGSGELGFAAKQSTRVVPVVHCPVAVAGVNAFLSDPYTVFSQCQNITVFSHKDTLLVQGAESRGTLSFGPPGRLRALKLDAGVFFQSNVHMLEKLTGELLDIVNGGALLDAYCGVGTFGAFLGDAFTSIDLVEENKAALALARENVPKGECYALACDAWVEAAKGPSYDFVILDPPRTGLSPGFRNWLLTNGPPVLAYVSCDPAALARDCAILAQGPYRLDSLSLFDFYPQTTHIESLAILARQNY